MNRAPSAARALVSAALVATSVSARPAWQLEQVEPRLTQLSGVWGTSSENVFAIGSRGAILHFDGNRWIRQRSGTGKNLASVWAASPGRAYAVGLDGVILTFDGRAWKTERSGTTKTLLGVWGSSDADVYAVGRGGTILHFDGRSWTRQTSGTRHDLTAVWGSSSTDVHAAGLHGTLLHSDGTRWSADVPAFGWHWTFTAIGGSSAANVYAGGWMRPSGQLGAEREGVLVRFDGETWSPLSGAESQIVEGIWVARRSEAYLVGPALNGLEQVRRYDGQGFEIVDSEGRFAPRAIWGAPTGELFVVGTNGFVLTKSAG